MAERPVASVDLRWEHDFQFTATDAYGHRLTIDAPAEEGAPFAGFKPGELLLASLAACSGIDVVNILSRQRQQLSGMEVKVTGRQQSDPPWAWEEIELEYILRGKGLKTSAVERAIHLSETRYCSVWATLAGRARITSTYRIVEE